MKADKKIIIKVKSKTEQRIMEDPNAEMITAWNIKRIAYVVLVLLIVTIMFIYYFSQNRTVNKNNQQSVHTAKQKSDAPVSVPMKVKKSVPKKIIQSEVFHQASEVKVAQVSKIAPHFQNKEIIKLKTLNPHLTRARLAQGVSDLEPYGEVELPIIINNSEAQGVFYFTDIDKMKGSIVFHEWLKQEKSIYKRKFIIRGNRWRLSTSKLFDINSSGEWQVRLITQSGEVLNKINFSVKK